MLGLTRAEIVRAECHASCCRTLALASDTRIMCAETFVSCQKKEHRNVRHQRRHRGSHDCPSPPPRPPPCVVATPRAHIVTRAIIMTASSFLCQHGNPTDWHFSSVSAHTTQTTTHFPPASPPTRLLARLVLFGLAPLCATNSVRVTVHFLSSCHVIRPLVSSMAHVLSVCFEVRSQHFSLCVALLTH